MFKETVVIPAWRDLEERAEPPAETRQENAHDRVMFGGPGLELLRRVHVQQLRVHMELFYEHGSSADLMALCAAFDLLDRGWYERSHCARSQATLIEALLRVLGLPAQKLLEADLQRRPIWPID